MPGEHSLTYLSDTIGVLRAEINSRIVSGIELASLEQKYTILLKRQSLKRLKLFMVHGHIPRGIPEEKRKFGKGNPDESSGEL